MSALTSFLYRTSAIILLFTAPAHADSIQMLPPVQSGTTDTVCQGTTNGKFLSWDGNNAIRCQTNVTVDSSGRVGIGTNTPIQSLDVAGTIRTNAGGVGGLLFGINPSTAGWSGRELILTLADGVGTNNDGIWIGPNVSGAAGGLGWVRLHANNIAMTGNNVTVGIGTMSAASKLDVNGGVKIGMDSATCTTAKAGTIRYNSGTVQVCNGTSWGNAFNGTTTYRISNEGTVNMGSHKFCALTRVQSGGWGSATSWYCEVEESGGVWTLRSHFQRNSENMPGNCSCRAKCMD